MSITDDERYRLVKIFGMMTLVCCAAKALDGAGSTMAVNWQRLTYHAKTRAWAKEKWASLQSNVGKDKDTMEQSDHKDYGELFRAEPARPSVVIPSARPNLGLQEWRPPRTASNEGAPMVASQWLVSRAAKTGSGPPVDKIGPVPGNMGGIIDLLVRVLRAQADSNFTMHQSFQTTMLENIQAMGTVVSTTGTIQEAKLTESKLRILQACSGEDNRSLFVLSKVYAKVDWEGHTTDNYSWVMWQLVVAIPGSTHKYNMHIPPKLVVMVKLLNFLADDDRTFNGCAKGITPFSVPWLLAEMVNNDLAKERYYQESTLKSTADIRKWESSSRFDPPMSLQELVRVLTNYIRLVEVLFKNKCPHLLCVIQVQDGLDYHKRLLEGRVTPALMINVLWRVHQDARQFFNRCKKWEEGNALPRSMLQTMVASLVDNVDIQMTLTCPGADFLGPGRSTTTGTKAKKVEGTRGNHGWQPTQNPSIPPICQLCIKELKRLYPTMGIVSFCKKGKVKYANVVIGGKGNCVNYGLLGKCTEECTYRHVVITVPKERQHDVKKTMTQGLANLAAAKKASAP
jgi:hypothetical protein